jgi:hypothetical protein
MRELEAAIRTRVDLGEFDHAITLKRHTHAISLLRAPRDCHEAAKIGKCPRVKSFNLVMVLAPPDVRYPDCCRDEKPEGWEA